MGGTQSVSEQINKTVNDVTTEVMSKITNTSTSITQQSNMIDISGSTGALLSGFYQKNAANINISALQEAATKGSFQSDLAAALKSALGQNADTLGLADQKASVNNTIENSIRTKITTESINAFISSVNQSNIAFATNSVSAKIINTGQDNVATAINKLSSSIAADINAKIASDTKTDSTSKQTLTNFVSNAIEAVRSSFKTATLAWMVVLVVVVIVCAVMAYVLRESIGKAITKIVS